jgi:hypothetical protein
MKKMQYMVIETFPEDPDPIYARFNSKGRMLPTGLHFVDSWLSADGGRCFQLMETDRPETFDKWTAEWSDLADFEIVPLGQKPEPKRENTR